MLEFVTPALVLDKESWHDYDARVFLYTKTEGTVIAKATSAKKVTSKLNAHLEPLQFVMVRLIQKRAGEGMFQVGDALVTDRCTSWREKQPAFQHAMNMLAMLKSQSFQGSTDGELWNLLEKIFMHDPCEPFIENQRAMLRVLGFDPRFAACALCSAKQPAVFSFHDYAFYCTTCNAGMELNMDGGGGVREGNIMLV